MQGRRGRELLRRHSTGSSRFAEIRGLYTRVTQGMRTTDTGHADNTLRNDIAGDRRGTASHKPTSRKGGGQ